MDDDGTKDAEGFVPKRPIGGWPTGTPLTVWPLVVYPVELSMFAFVDARLVRDAAASAPKLVAVLLLAA